MQRFLLIEAITLALSLFANPMLGQVRNGALGKAVQGTERTTNAADHHGAGVAGETIRHEGNTPPLPATPQPSISAGNANAGVRADFTHGGEAHINVAPQPGAGVNVQAGPRFSVNVTGDNRPDQWRYRWENGRWWYWTPENRWMWYSDDGGWVFYDSAVPYSTGYGSYDVPSSGYYYPNYGTYYYPGYGYRYPGYWYGGGYYYHPGISIGVGGIGIGIGGGYGHHGHHR